MSSHPDTKALLQTLREVMKARKYTYARLAREMGISEVTIKRVFAGQGCSMDRLALICERLGTSLLEVAALARSEDEVDYFLTEEQEAFFASMPACFGIFKELYGGRSAKEVAHDWGMNRQQLYQVLRALERQGLLDVLPGEQVRFRIRGTIRMTHRGALAKKVLRSQTMAFLDHIDDVLENDDVCHHSAELELAAVHVEEFVEEIHALGAKYRARAFRDRSLFPKDQLRSVRWLFAFAPFRTDWRQYGKPQTPGDPKRKRPS